MPEKKEWVRPVLVSLGTVEDLTQSHMRDGGERDGKPGKLGRDDPRFLLISNGDFLGS